MPKLVKDGLVLENELQLIDDVEATLPPEKNALLPLELFLNTTEQDRAGFGVWLAPADNVSKLKNIASSIPVVACRFDNFMDGRGFSQARTLRDSYGYEGELRAAGSYILDQVFYLSRCGFNSFEVAEQDFNAEAVVSALNDFSESYQAASDTSEPLFRRRA